MQAKPKKGYRGLPLEGVIARWYARLGRRYLHDYRELAEVIAGKIDQGSSVLEVGPGAGFLAIELAKLNGSYRIVGLDISKSLVRIATENATRAGVAVTFTQGNAAAMPFASDSFDFIACRAAFKNIAEPIQALKEMYRVLRPGGSALIFDLRRDASASAINTHVSSMGLGPINSLLMKWMFKQVLVKRAYTPDQFRHMAIATPFGTCVVREDPLRLEVVLTK